MSNKKIFFYSILIIFFFVLVYCLRSYLKYNIKKNEIKEIIIAPLDS